MRQKYQKKKKRIVWCTKVIKLWDVNVVNMIISKFAKTENNSKCLIEYLHEVIKSLVLILHVVSRYVKTFKHKSEDDNKNNKLIS